MNLDTARAADAADPLAPLRAHFDLPEGLVYLDGNSLGALPRATPARVARTLQQEWGHDLIQSWNTAGWIDLPRRLGDRLAPWVGARAGELLFADSTSINLYKVLHAALQLQQGQRRVIVSERNNFQTDNYIAASVARAHGAELRLVERDEDLPALLDEQCAVLMLTHVHYRSGRMHNMAQLTRWAHQAGALTVWDLAHSAGAVPVDLLGSDADFAVGCGYKYLNGGPGAPGFVWAHPRHHGCSFQPLAGWLGHARPFAFVPDYEPAAGIQQYQCGTPPILGLAALDAAFDVWDAAQALGGMPVLRAKSLALTQAFIDGLAARVPQAVLLTPREPARRGSQVSIALPQIDGHAVMQALIARGVVGDFRAGAGTGEPDLLRFGFTPLYTRHADVALTLDALSAVLGSGEWREARFQHKGKVT